MASKRASIEGDIVEADATGRLIRSVGDPDRVVTLRSTVKAFGSWR
jgi:L-asparaginase II